MKALSKIHGILALLLCCLVFFSGCRSTEGTMEPDPPEDTPLLTVLMDQLPESLDPLEADTPEAAALTNYLCDGLLEYNAETGRPGPCLAQSWDVSEDGLTLTLYLETGAVFADGASVDAQAVMQNIQRWQSHGSESLREQLAAIQSMQASGTSQVVLTLSQPDAGLFAVFCSPETRLVSPNAISQGTVGENPQGAGMYQLEDRQNGVVVLGQREDYFKGEAPHQQVEFRSATTQQAQEWMSQSENYLVAGDLVSDIAISDGYQRLTATGFHSYQLYLNVQQLPLSTVRQLIGQTIQNGVSFPTGYLDQGGLLPDAVYQGQDVVFSANTNATLAQYSYSSLTLIVEKEDSLALDLAQRIQQALSQQHCTLEIQALEEADFAQALAQGEYHLCLTGETILDCSDWLAQFSSPDTDPTHLQDNSLRKQALNLAAQNYDKARTDGLEIFCSDLAQQAAVLPICQNGISVLSSREYYLDPWGCFLA